MTLQEAVSVFVGIDIIEDAKYIVEDNKVEFVFVEEDMEEYNKVLGLFNELEIKPQKRYTFRDGGDKYSAVVVKWSDINEHLNLA